MGLFDKKKTQKTYNYVDTRTDITTGDIGLTGNAAVALSREATSVANSSLEAGVINHRYNTELAGSFIDEGNLTLRELSGDVKDTHSLNVGYLTGARQQESDNFSQLLGGASQYLDHTEKIATVSLDKADRGATRIVDGAQNVLSSARNISDRLLPQTKELQQIAIGALVLTGAVLIIGTYRKGK